VPERKFGEDLRIRGLEDVRIRGLEDEDGRQGAEVGLSRSLFTRL
jgi:hypothetical protein